MLITRSSLNTARATTAFYQGLLAHLVTFTRNDVQYGITGPPSRPWPNPTAVQRRAFGRIGAPIPTTLT